MPPELLLPLRSLLSELWRGELHLIQRPPARLHKHHDDNYFTPPPSNVPPSIAADCSVDVTAKLSTWIASMPDGSRLSFGSGCYRIEGTLELTDRFGLVLDGGEFRSFNPPTDRSIWRVINSSGVVFRNMLIQGSFRQTNPPHIVEALQHAHGIDLRGSSAEVDHLTATNLAGDCVYFGLGTGKSSTPIIQILGLLS